MAKQVSMFESTTINKHHNTKTQEITKFADWQTAIEAESFMNYPGKEEWRQRLIYTMLKWAELPTSETIMDFCIDYKLDVDTLKYWADKYPDLGKAYKIFKRILGNKSYKGAKHKIYDKDVVFKNLHTYDPDFDEVNKYWAELKKQDDPQLRASAKIIVEMEATPTTDLVKERVKDGNTIRDENKAGPLQIEAVPTTDMGRSGE